MKRADEIIPWKVTDISFRPFKDFWSMNPSLHFDGHTWRCVLRCADYCMENGVTVRSRKAKPNEARTKNAMVILDPSSWKAIEIYKMHELDALPRASCDSVGYEDIRLFRTDKGGLQGIAASLHLRRDGSSRNRHAEQAVLSFGPNYDIVDAKPIRYGYWTEQPQKNWAPFDHCVEPRFLYAIDRGTLFDDRGALQSGIVKTSTQPRSIPDPDAKSRGRARERAQECESKRARETRRRDREAPGADPSISSYEGLRGGTQLVRVADDTWVGIGHAMQFIRKRKIYWHCWYASDSRGKMKSIGPPMKLATNGIEFAAGLVITGDRVVVSFGVDDMEAKIAETKLSAVMGMLRPVEPQS